ncbi:uncharacterized protein LOC141837336 [Curcuma longa]|uniref:uncharacterized protein LOC141837336 n=1 Tax=Curcuma longa TaxID=136217 RepID=UPI003D9E2F76
MLDPNALSSLSETELLDFLNLNGMSLDPSDPNAFSSLSKKPHWLKRDVETDRARSEDIPLFGIRKRIKKIEEEAEEIVQEGEKAVQKGIVAAEKEIQAAEEGIVASASLGLAGDLLQAGAVAGAEAVGVLVSVSIVNGILAPER